jgi:phosphatidylglycerophosphate synthase
VLDPVADQVFVATAVLTFAGHGLLHPLEGGTHRRLALVRPLAWATGAVSVYAIWDYGRAVRRGNTGSGSNEPTPEA